ncbi:MAG: SDR family oxidoreductase [Burkholderiaceae bacterium]|nr:MAG: SDR family oxidoreductase [Burkholderiaceae bacterium]
MDFGIAGKWALVGGASRGLGHGCASALAHEGVNVVMVARRKAVLEQSVAALKTQVAATVQVIGVAADITTPEGRAAAFAAHREFDIVVTNAGGPPAGNFRDWGRDEWISALNANMLTAVELIKATIDGMTGRGFGRIVNITSTSVKAPIDVLGLSNGARSGLTGFVAGIARSHDIAGNGVTINNLLPGRFDTDRIQSLAQSAAASSGKTVADIRAAQQAAIPAQRYGTAEEFGQVCAFLCSRQAAYLTGQNILLDGGGYPGTF